MIDSAQEGFVFMWFDPAITMLYLNNLCVLAFAAGFVYFWLADRRSIYSYWLFR